MQPSNELVEWDYTHAVVLNIKRGDTTDPHPTGIPRRPDSRTRWLRVFVEYPDDYLPDFEELLGPGVYDLNEDGTLRKYFPQANYSVDSVRSILLDRVSGMKRDALLETDGYVIREMETGTPMPAEVKSKRDAARKTADALKDRVKNSAPKDLISLDIYVPHVPAPRHFVQPDYQSRFGPGQNPEDGPGQPGDRPSALRPGEEPPYVDPNPTDDPPPPPGIDGAPIEEVEGK